jgi:hypothetical protein
MNNDFSTVKLPKNNMAMNLYGASGSGIPSDKYRLAEYGSILVPAIDLAYIRGSGNYNPNNMVSSKYGQAYQNAFPVYANETGYYTNQPKQKELPVALNATNKYIVGVTGNIIQDSAEWSNKNIDNPLQGLSRINNNNQTNSPGPSVGHSPGTVNGGPDPYQTWALKSTNMQPSALLMFYFSKDNVDYIHETIKSEIKRLRNVTISRQSDNELLVIMRNHYMYALNGYLPNPYESIISPDKKDTVYTRGSVYGYGANGQLLSYGPKGLEDQIERLNKTTVEECVRQVLSGVDMYTTYIKDASSLPMPLDRPELTSMKGANSLQPNVGFTDGDNILITNYNERNNIFGLLNNMKELQ